MDGWVYEWMNEHMKKWMNGWMKGWIDEWMDDEWHWMNKLTNKLQDQTL